MMLSLQKLPVPVIARVQGVATAAGCQLVAQCDLAVASSEAQFAQAFENVGKVLRAAGASFDDVVEMVTYHTDMRDLQLFMEVKNRYFTNRLPTWTGIGVSSLAMPGLTVEIKCTARLPG